jgi:hypothetical protein
MAGTMALCYNCSALLCGPGLSVCALSWTLCTFLGRAFDCTSSAGACNVRFLTAQGFTTTAQANSGVQQYWAHRQAAPCESMGTAARHCSAGALPGKDPGGEHEIAERVKREGRQAHVKLGSDNVFTLSDRRASGRLRRGIVGFTGTSPTAAQHQQPRVDEPDPSQTYAINGMDARRPWKQGVKGYTGHQVPGQPQGEMPSGSMRTHSCADKTHVLSIFPLPTTGLQRAIKSENQIVMQAVLPWMKSKRLASCSRKASRCSILLMIKATMQWHRVAAR